MPVSPLYTGQNAAPSIDPAQLIQALQSVIGGARGLGGGQPSDPTINVSPQGKQNRQPISTKGRRFAPELAVPVVGGDDRLKPAQVAPAPGEAPEAPAAPASAGAPPANPVKAPLPGGVPDGPVDPMTATPPDPNAQQGGILQALGLGSVAPYMRAAGAGMAAGAGQRNFADALAKGFGGAQGFYSDQEKDAKNMAFKQAELDREEEWKKKSWSKGLSDDQFDRSDKLEGRQLQRDTLDVSKANKEADDSRRSEDDYVKATEDARQEADAKVNTVFGTDATMNQPGEREAARVQALTEARRARGLGYGSGKNQDDPFVPSRNQSHADQELANIMSDAQTYKKTYFIKAFNPKTGRTEMMQTGPDGKYHPLSEKTQGK